MQRPTGPLSPKREEELSVPALKSLTDHLRARGYVDDGGKPTKKGKAAIEAESGKPAGKRSKAQMESERFNMSLRKYLKHVGVTSQQEIERVVREKHLEGKGKLKVRMVLTAEGTDLRHEVDGEIDLG